MGSKDLSQNKALMTASVATMIDSFNGDNMDLLTKLGYQVHVAANFGEGNPSAECMSAYKKELEAADRPWFHIPIPRNPAKIPQIILSCRMVRQLVKEHGYRIVHCHSPVGSVVARLACVGLRKRGTKVVYTAHGFHFFKGASKAAWLLYYPIELVCSAFTDLIITINGEDYQRAQKLWAKQVAYIPGVGVDTTKFCVTPRDSRSLRSEFGVSEEDFLYISVGELSTRKNHEIAIRALAKNNNPRQKYLIVGNGPLEQYLKELVQKLHLQNQVIFAGYRRDIPDLLHAADAFVFPSLQEGLPVALMEAMACGLSVVCSSIRGNVDLIENGKGGWVYQPRDVDGFADGMNKVMSGSCAMGEHNVKTMEKFDKKAVNARMEEIYRSVL